MQLNKLLDHNSDLKRLWDEGCEIEISEGFLIMHHIPYLNPNKEIKYGRLICPIDPNDNITIKIVDHTVYFEGEAPCDKSGQILNAIINQKQDKQLTSNFCGNYYLSSKPNGGYVDFFDKMTTYADIISSPAHSLDNSVTYKTSKVIESHDTDSVFNYFDYNSSRAKIYQISKKLADLKIAIIGVGGTGSYILDSVAKTPVMEIHLFDGDLFKIHNAFRSPGAASIGKLNERLKKTDYFKEIYSNMHRKIFSHPYYVEITNVEELSEMDFVFLSLDNPEAKKVIVDFLKEWKIPFVDSGLGLENVNNELYGTIAVTTATGKKNDHLEKRISFKEVVDNEYNDNIQIAELNSMNACMAVIKWKKLFGFYHDSKKEHYSEYTIEFNLLTSKDYDA